MEGDVPAHDGGSAIICAVEQYLAQNQMTGDEKLELAKLRGRAPLWLFRGSSARPASCEALMREWIGSGPHGCELISIDEQHVWKPKPSQRQQRACPRRLRQHTVEPNVTRCTNKQTKRTHCPAASTVAPGGGNSDRGAATRTDMKAL